MRVCGGRSGGQCTGLGALRPQALSSDWRGIPLMATQGAKAQEHKEDEK